MADAGLRQTLGSHKGDGAGAGADIQQIPVCLLYSHRGAEKDTVGVYLHGAALIHHFELLETKNSHLVESLKAL